MSRDPRLTLWRPDLAGRSLEGVEPAVAYADPQPMRVIAPAVGIHAEPDLGSEQRDQALFGEAFDLLIAEAGFGWGQARRDGYVGYVELSTLGGLDGSPSHRVSAVRTYAFETPSIKARAKGPYSLNALVTVEAREGRFAKVTGAGWMVEAHLAPIGVFKTDYVAVAERFLGAAYLWGGREASGVDCSGLVQQARLACGAACPRDTDQQQGLGCEVDPDRLIRGDLVFWRGHVGIMADSVTLLHANAHHMATVLEPLAAAVARIADGPTGLPVAYRRL